MWINDELLTWAGAATQNGRLIFTPTMMETNPDLYAASWLSFWALTSGNNSGSRVRNLTITRNDDYAVDPDALSGEFTLDMDENYNKEAIVGSAYTFPEATLMLDGVAFEDESYPVTRRLSLGTRVIIEDLADATEYTPLAPGTYTVSYLVDGIERTGYTFTAANSVKPTTNLLDEEGWGHSWINSNNDTITTDKVLGSVPVYDEWITYHFNYQVGDSQIFLPVRGDWSVSINPDWFYGLSIRFSGTEGLWLADKCTEEVYKIFAYEGADYTYEGLFGENIRTEKSEHFLSYRAEDIVDAKGIVSGIKLYIVIDGEIGRAHV